MRNRKGGANIEVRANAEGQEKGEVGLCLHVCVCIFVCEGVCMVETDRQRNIVSQSTPQS